MESLDSHLFDIFHLSDWPKTAMTDVIITLMRFITHLGDGDFLIVLSVLALGMLIIRKLYLTGVLWTLYIAFSFLLSANLKTLISRERPADIYHLIETSSPAMPSGHALKSTIVYVGIYLLALRLFLLSQSQRRLMKLMFIFPFIIGLSRLFLGVHWPSDIMIGWVLGAGIAWIFSRYIT